jgi:hypothetical protein
MVASRSLTVLPAACLFVALFAETRLLAADGDTGSRLAAAVAAAERILIAKPEKKGVDAGQMIDVAPGEKFFVEIQRTLRGPGRKGAPALVVNGGDEKQHPRFVAGEQYVFLLKKDADGKRWINLGTSEIPVRDGKVQFLEGGKVIEELALADFEALAASDSSASAEKYPTRDALTGKWLFVSSDSRSASDLYLWLLELKQDEGAETTVKLAASSALMEASTIKTASIEGDDVHVVVEGDGMTVDFRGRFEGGFVRGNVLFDTFAVVPARMVPTDVKNMRGYDKPVADRARDDFLEAVGQDSSFAALSRFVKRHAQSPLALPAYAELIGQARTEKYDREKFEKLAAEYLQTARFWGERLETRAYVDMGLTLSRRDYLPELALEYLDKAQERLQGDIPGEWKQLVGIERGKRLIAAGKEADGVAVLSRIREEFPFEPDVTYALARQAEAEKKLDEALSLYGEIAVLPLMEQGLLQSLKAAGRKLSREQYPNRVVSRLWAEKNGDSKGLSDWLDEVYESKLRSIATEKRPPRNKNEGTRVVLCELFTNGDCQPCVSADAATTALESSYARSEVIVLRYHQPRPGPDPFSNEDTVDRFKQYGLNATPTVILNGRRFSGGGGPLSEAPRTYLRLKAFIDPALEEKIELRLDLSARAEQGKIAIAAKAEGLNEFPANARLTLVLAEERIECPLHNGIRSHEMIVRTFPGGLGGTAPVKGELSYNGQVDLAALKKRLAKQLAATERESDIEFDEKPLDLKALHVVALLQNSETGEVLQAAAVPVTGPTIPPAESKAADKPAANKSASSGN